MDIDGETIKVEQSSENEHGHEVEEMVAATDMEQPEVERLGEIIRGQDPDMVDRQADTCRRPLLPVSLEFLLRNNSQAPDYSSDSLDNNPVNSLDSCLEKSPGNNHDKAVERQAVYTDIAEEFDDEIMINRDIHDGTYNDCKEGVRETEDEIEEMMPEEVVLRPDEDIADIPDNGMKYEIMCTSEDDRVYIDRDEISISQGEMNCNQDDINICQNERVSSQCEVDYSQNAINSSQNEIASSQDEVEYSQDDIRHTADKMVSCEEKCNSDRYNTEMTNRNVEEKEHNKVEEFESHKNRLDKPVRKRQCETLLNGRKAVVVIRRLENAQGKLVTNIGSRTLQNERNTVVGNRQIENRQGKLVTNSGSQTLCNKQSTPVLNRQLENRQGKLVRNRRGETLRKGQNEEMVHRRVENRQGKLVRSSGSQTLSNRRNTMVVNRQVGNRKCKTLRNRQGNALRNRRNTVVVDRRVEDLARKLWKQLEERPENAARGNDYDDGNDDAEDEITTDTNCDTRSTVDGCAEKLSNIGEQTLDSKKKKKRNRDPRRSFKRAQGKKATQFKKGHRLNSHK